MSRKKSVIIICLLVVLILIVTGCGNKKDKPNKKDMEGLNVYTSFYPIYDFTSKIAGDKVSVHNMIPAGTEAHGWEPSPSDIVKLEEADMFVYNGIGLEYWVDDVLNTLENQDLIIVEASKGVELLENEEGEEDEDSESDNHNHGDSDPHIWTDPLNVKKEMENIKIGLIELDPENSDYYEENFKKHSKELDKLDKEYEEGLKDLATRDIVVSHKSFTYMSNTYDLNQISISGLSPDAEPNPDKMTEIIKFVEEKKVKVIFFEELGSRKIANAIADATGADVGVLNPLEGLSDKEIENNDDYFSIMRRNLESLKKALK